MGEKDFTKAEEHFRDIIDVYPEGSLADDAEYRMAIIFYEKGERNKCIEVLSRLKDRYPDSELVPVAELKIAEILIKKGNLVKAKEVLAKLIVDFEGTDYVKVASKYFGDILRKEREFRDAIRYYRDALDSRRGDFNADIQYTIGQLYEELEDLDNAVVEYMKVGYIYPDSTA